MPAWRRLPPPQSTEVLLQINRISVRSRGASHPPASRARAEGEEMKTAVESRWTPHEDDRFRTMVEANIGPELIAAKLNRTVHALKARAYTIGLPLKWFKLKAKGK